jgi:hypothetical protein
MGRDRTAGAVFLLSSFSLIFTVSSAVGRVCLGTDAALSSRYVAYIIPFLVALHLALSCWIPSAQVRGLLLATFCAASVVKEYRYTEHHRVMAGGYLETKAGFRGCVLDGFDVLACNASWPVSPDPAASRLALKFFYLRERRLSLFRP